MRFAVIAFPGSNELDCFHAVQDVIGDQVELVRHTETDLSAYDCILIPGGFSYGDYLRSGAIARFAPVMEAVVTAANQGKYVLGIGNGFQILLESELLPGAMLKNEQLTFHCAPAALRVENNRNPFTIDYDQREVVQIPVAHGEGNYFCDEVTLKRLRENDQIVLRYEGSNPNGSIDAIAGICNEAGNVLGMMPHPERAIDELLGSTDGKRMFTSILKTWRESHGTAIHE